MSWAGGVAAVAGVAVVGAPARGAVGEAVDPGAAGAVVTGRAGGGGGVWAGSSAGAKTHVKMATTLERFKAFGFIIGRGQSAEVYGCVTIATFEAGFARDSR